MWAVLQTVSSVLAIELGGKGTETSSVHQPRRAQAGHFSEGGEARNFDIDVSDVDVSRNLWQVHVLHSRDCTSWGC